MLKNKYTEKDNWPFSFPFYIYLFFIWYLIIKTRSDKMNFVRKFDALFSKLTNAYMSKWMTKCEKCGLITLKH